MFKINKPQKWDGKWRMVMFDLPVRFSKARNALRFKLKQLGFIQFQKSVWIYPYSCKEEIAFVSDYYRVGRYVELLEISSINNDLKFKKHFKLL
jgi:DNA-binding transcriptional regulator PaaX